MICTHTIALFLSLSSKQYLKKFHENILELLLGNTEEYKLPMQTKMGLFTRYVLKGVGGVGEPNDYVLSLLGLVY